MNDLDPIAYDDDHEDDLTPEEAIEMLMADGYSHDEAVRMVGLYDPDEYVPANGRKSDFPDDWYGDIADLVDPEDFE